MGTGLSATPRAARAQRRLKALGAGFELMMNLARYGGLSLLRLPLAALMGMAGLVAVSVAGWDVQHHSCAKYVNAFRAWHSKQKTSGPPQLVRSPQPK